MNLLNQEILSAIDNIDNIIQESEMSVLFALCECYEKQAMILENTACDNLSEFSVFQEGFIMEDGESTKKNVLRSLLDGIKSIFKRFVSFLRRKCKYVGLLVQMKRNPNKEVNSPLPLGETYETYVEFEKWIDKLISYMKDTNPEDLDDAGKMNELYYKKIGFDMIPPPDSYPSLLQDLMNDYTRIDRGEKPHYENSLKDAGDRKVTGGYKMFDSDFNRKTGRLVTIKSIVENIERLDIIRENIAKKVDSFLKIFEKYNSIHTDNEYVKNVIEGFSTAKKEIMYFMKTDVALERCLTNQFKEFLEYSNKHKETKG